MQLTRRYTLTRYRRRRPLIWVETDAIALVTKVCGSFTKFEKLRFATQSVGVPRAKSHVGGVSPSILPLSDATGCFSEPKTCKSLIAKEINRGTICHPSKR